MQNYITARIGIGINKDGQYAALGYYLQDDATVSELIQSYLKDPQVTFINLNIPLPFQDAEILDDVPITENQEPIDITA